MHSLTAHRLLSGAARALDPDVLAAYTSAAESMLNIPPDDDLGNVTAVLNALAFQVNLLIELPPDAGLVSEIKRGPRTTIYFKDVPPISALAIAALSPLDAWVGIGVTAEDFTDDEYPTVMSVRPSADGGCLSEADARCRPVPREYPS
jgi:hypothetical protein